jgi:hypothetical protein
VNAAEEPTHADLSILHNVLKNEPEEQLLKRRYAYWNKELMLWHSKLIGDLKAEAVVHVMRYLRLIRGGKAEGSDSGILDDRIRCINRESHLDGYVLLSIGDARVLCWHTGTEVAQYVFEKWS